MTFAIGLIFIGMALYFARKFIITALYDALIRESIRRQIAREKREAIDHHHVMFFDHSEIWGEEKGKKEAI